MPRYEPFDWYHDPLYYDIIFGEGTVQETRFLLDALAQYGRTNRANRRRVLEPACGSGRLLVSLAHHGCDVTGFDCCRGMIAYARARIAREQVEARITHGRMEDFHLRNRTPFDLAHCLVSTFKYLLTEEDALAHLHGMANVMRPGGIYVLGLHLTEYDDRRRNRERWVVERDGVRVVCNIQGWAADVRKRREQVRSRLVITEKGKPAERRLESNWIFRTYDAKQLKALLRKAPEFEHVATHDFNHDIDRTIALDGEQLDSVLVLRKR